MKAITGFFIIVTHLVVGNLLSSAIGGFIPGSVVGMLLLFLSLMTGIVKDSQIREVASFLTDNMTIFFLPAFMGIMDLWGIISMNFVAWIAVVLLSTLCVLATVGYTTDMMAGIVKRRKRL